MRFLTLFISTLALSSGVSASSMSSSSNDLSTVNRAGGWGNVDASLEAGRYESSHQHQWGTMAEPAGTPIHFAYSPWDLEAGPSMWATVGANANPSWSTCAGNSQSPVALPAYVKAKPDTAGILKKLSPIYGDSMPAGSLTLVNTGHALQVNFPNSLWLTGGALGVDANGKPIQYQALQMHMHGRSEHSIGGARFPLELHIVHKDPTRLDTDPRQLSVVGVMVEESPDDTPNPALVPLSNLVMSADFTSPLNNKDANATVTMGFSLTKLLPQNLDYYHYNGSLTTPPCSEKVVWHVLTNPITASRAQIMALTAPFGDVGNARPTQPIGTRQIIVSSFQTTPNGNNINSASSLSMTLAGVVSLVMAIVKMQ